MKPRSKVACSVCGQLISISNIKAHERRHRDHPETFEVPKYRVDHEGLDCKFCGKTCKNNNSLRNHERLCKLNPNRQQTTYEKYGYVEGFTVNHVGAWNKGLTKETCDTLRVVGTKNRQHALNNPEKYHFTHTAETRKHLSDIALEGNFETHFGKRSQHIEYKGVNLQSSFELRVAVELDSNDVEWVRPTRLPYTAPNGSQHHYSADFYLPEYNIYLDPKNDFLIDNVNPMFGYSDKDKIQWVMEQNSVTVIILNERELEWKIIKQKIEDASIAQSVERRADNAEVS